jgi:hypothetical protein
MLSWLELGPRGGLGYGKAIIYGHENSSIKQMILCFLCGAACGTRVEWEVYGFVLLYLVTINLLFLVTKEKLQRK